MTDMQTFEMLWDCRMCGTKKLLGMKNRHCPNCGAAQDPTWRYFPSDTDMVFIEHPQFVGADKMCPACNQPNAADAKFCVSCGADLATAKEAAKVEGLSTGFEGAKGVLDDVVKKKWDAEQAAIQQKAAQKRRILGLPPLVAALIAVALLAGGIFAFLALSRSQDALTVKDLDWRYTINLEKYQPFNVGAWISGVPADAYNRSCGQKIKGYNQVPDGTERVCRNVTVRVPCGYEYRDNGNGSGSRVTKYCSESQQQCSDQTKYRQVPYYDTWCNYTVNRWGDTEPASINGGPDQAPAYPQVTTSDVSTLGNIREKSRKEEYWITFNDKSSEKLIYQPTTLQDYQRFRISQQWTVDRNKLGTIYWNTLKQVAQ